MWKNSHDLLSTIHEAHERLQKDGADVGKAHAEARLLNAAVKTIAVSLEHARLTNRLRNESALLPMIGFDEATESKPRSIEHLRKPKPRQIEAKDPKPKT